ncbi:hypothetical protein [Angustibacter aerolatus]
MNTFAKHEYVDTAHRASYGSAEGLLDLVRASVGNKKVRLVLGVQGDDLDYWPSGFSGAHAITVNGWTGAKGWVWDPLNKHFNKRAHGVHDVSRQNLFEAGDANSRQLIW